MKNREPCHLLDRMLSLELRKNCTDQLVMGGLGAYVSQHWQQEAEAEAETAEEHALVASVVASLAPYRSLTQEQRGQAIASAQALLQDLMSRGPATEAQQSASPEEAGQSAQPSAEPASADRPSSDGGAVPSRRPPRSAPQARPYGLAAPVTTLSGVNVGYAAKLNRLGVHTVRDLLYLFPRHYNDFSHMKRIADLEIGAVETVVGSVWEVSNITGRNNRVRTEALINDESGTIRAIWFNQPYLAATFKRGTAVVLSGKIDVYLGRRVMESPEYELMESSELLHTGRLVPVYPLTEGLGARWMRRLQKRVVDRWATQVADYLPVSVREQAQLGTLPLSLAQMHFPDNADSLEQARRRLAFDELFLIQVGLMQRRRAWQQDVLGTAMHVDRESLDEIVSKLPFTLTNAQQRALSSILEDISLERPMARLVQGDVGSGKTVVALLAMLVVVANGYQAAIMAPTEILARQHYATIVTLLATIARAPGPLRARAGLAAEAPVAELDDLRMKLESNDLPDLVAIPPLPMLPNGLRVARLIGSLSESGKQEVRDKLAAGQVDIIVGTHALLEESVAFDRLAFVVIDEQHRFGVMQRAVLRQKGYNPHVLVMTATPIPRTLALTMYGDLDISTIDELPPGRQVIKTRWLEPRDRDRAYAFVRRQVQEGHQAFVICPLVEESEAMETKAAVAEYERLKSEVFPDLRVGLVHGRLRPAEKDATMNSFARGELDILVATAVVEVGVDIPNATVMLIEGANHFGLAQLHQFRGRVGRGQDQAYCILLADTSRVTEENPRLLAVEQTHDGFKLAEIDLEIRGMGEFFGTRQSGLPDLKVARLSDTAILELAREQARALFERDPELSQPENQSLAQQVASFWQKPASDLGRGPAGEGDLS